ncbi:glycoside hydrolase [Spirosoma taeanense]|uniref:Glycoside hydrolase n=1 Tax=Spirosoma taeanense TaxID=2735870 RepID=A0A6M5Y2R3_9BACT|nr:glycosyl hydrolase [Spirosoma taeanense]QJW88089.1 glycoside hydrolase [Spirosoma taeanense]
MNRIIILLILLPGFVLAQADPALRDGFLNPPNAARPRVWWHWMNGNVTKDGIRKDLLWMHRSGIGGFQNFDAGLTTPQVVDKRLTYMTPAWKDAFLLATRLADSLKLEMAIAGSPGWSQSGGPWVAAKDGMKKLVWREIIVPGGQAFSGALPKPYAETGPFQNVPVAGESIISTQKEAAPPAYYEDITVVAYRLAANDVAIASLQPKITSSGGRFSLQQLTDGDIANASFLPFDSTSGLGWIQYEFQKPQTIKALTVVGGGIREPFNLWPPGDNRSLDVSEDGVHFRPVTPIPQGGVAQLTITIPPTTARYFRVSFRKAVPTSESLLVAKFIPAKPATGTDIAELVLHPVTRINHAEEKAGFAATYDLEKYPTPSSGDAVSELDVIDLTSKLTTDGRLNWTPPAGGHWKILRFGYSLTGKKNHPASPEATGLEVDKLDARAVRAYFETYLNQYKDATGGLMGAKGLQYMVTDSYEAGQETWTPKMAEEFQKRRGYNLRPWMPVLTGQVVKSTQASEQFLWDWRKTISELIAENYYDQLTRILASYGMKRYSESHENGRLYIVDGMDAKRTAAVPMSATWVFTGFGSTFEMAQADIRESASVAHIYGQNLVAAESLTAFGLGGSAFAYSPERLKPTVDLELASGLNRFVIHTSAHQPVDDKVPGLGLFIFGQWFTRHETWAGQAKAWTDYLARSSYMLQQGKFVADVVYYYGEDNNITGLFGRKLPDVPAGYGYDFINADALVTLLSVKDGRLVTPSGMSYRVLALDSNARTMSLPVLRKIAALVKAGATVTGAKALKPAGLQDDTPEFTRLVNQIWHAGNRNVSTGKRLEEVLSSLNIQPDFSYTKPQADTKLLYVHRKLIDGDLYWVNSRNDRAQQLEVTFRVTGKVPQIWHPETGRIEPASYSMANGATKVTLSLSPNDAVFVIFRGTATQPAVTLPARTEQVIGSMEGPWTVAFQPDRGAPAGATFDKLVSYTEKVDTGIRYFSGAATYTQTINLPANAINKGASLWLDLGEVKELAEVKVNGKSLGVVWKKPFRVEATNALRVGANQIEIKVVNLWVNRLIGDAQPDVKPKSTYTTMPFYQASSPLLPSGLLGPVKIISLNP